LPFTVSAVVLASASEWATEADERQREAPPPEKDEDKALVEPARLRTRVNELEHLCAKSITQSVISPPLSAPPIEPALHHALSESANTTMMITGPFCATDDDAEAAEAILGYSCQMLTAVGYCSEYLC
jgi:hypothetical protein